MKLEPRFPDSVLIIDEDYTTHATTLARLITNFNNHITLYSNYEIKNVTCFKPIDFNLEIIPSQQIIILDQDDFKKDLEKMIMPNIIFLLMRNNNMVIVISSASVQEDCGHLFYGIIASRMQTKEEYLFWYSNIIYTRQVLNPHLLVSWLDQIKKLENKLIVWDQDCSNNLFSI